MGDWNFKQVLGVALITLGSIWLIIGLLMLLFIVLEPAVAITIIFTIILFSGIWLWKSGSKENNKKD